jgi:hypothetical protein
MAGNAVVALLALVYLGMTVGTIRFMREDWTEERSIVMLASGTMLAGSLLFLAYAMVVLSVTG